MAENPPGFVRWPVYHRVRIQFRRDDSRPSITGAKPRVWNGSAPSNPSRIGLFLRHSAITVVITNLYSWHIRPNVGL